MKRRLRRILKKYPALLVAALLCMPAASKAEPGWKGIQERLKKNAAPPAEAAPPAAEQPVEPPAAGVNSEAAIANAPAAPSVPAEDGQAPSAVEQSQDGSLVPAAPGTIGLPGIEGGGRGASKVSINLGSEGEEKGTVNLFKDPRFLQMLGTNPRFIYDAADVSDPMVFPPARNDAIKNELWLRHETLIKESKLNLQDPLKTEFDRSKVAEAIQTLGKIKVLKDPRFIEQVDKRVRELSAASQTEPPAPESPAVQIDQPLDLPEEVRTNIRGILASGANPICLVGDFMLKVGDAIPDYPNVKVTAIHAQVVTFEVTNGRTTREYEVAVKPYEEDGLFKSSTKNARPDRPAKRQR